MLKQTQCLSFVKSIFFLILTFNMSYLSVPGISVILMVFVSIVSFLQQPLRGHHKADIFSLFLIYIILSLSLMVSKDFFYSFALLILGYSTRKMPTAAYLLALILCLISLKIGMYGRLQFENMGPNYTAFFIYLISINLFFNFLVSNKYLVYRYLTLIPSLLPESRAIFLTLFSTGFAVSSKKQKLFLIVASVVTLSFIVGSGIFSDRSGGSNGERLFLINSVITGNVFGIENKQFSLIGTYSPFRNGGFVQLHNTLATWWYHSHYLLYLLLILLVYQLGKSVVVFFLLMLPLLFITVEPGIFYFFIGTTYYQMKSWRNNVYYT